MADFDTSTSGFRSGNPGDTGKHKGETDFKYRKFLESTAQLLYRLTPDGKRLIEVSGTGVSEQNLDMSSGIESLFESIHPDDRQNVVQSWRDALISRSVFYSEHRIRRSDGTLGWMLSRAVPITGSDGELFEWIGTALDISRHKQTEDELNTARKIAEFEHRQLWEIFRHSPAMIATLKGKDHVFDQINPLYQKSLGDRELIGKPVAEAIPEFINQGLIDLLDHVYEKGEIIQAKEKKIYLNRKEGGEPDEAYFNFVCIPVRSEDTHQVTGVSLHAVEVTGHVMARRQAEMQSKALHVSKERFRTIVESATEYAIFTMDMNGRINSWNSGARRLLGWSTEEAIGKHSEILFPDPGGVGSEKASREIRTAWETGSATNERWHIRKDGSYFWASGMVMAIRDPENEKITGFVKIIQDKTEQKRREEQDRFHISLSDALRPLYDPVQIQMEASKVLGEHLGIAQVGYAKVDDDETWARTEGEYSDGQMLPFQGRRITLASFGERMVEEARKGVNIVVHDVNKDPRTASPKVLRTFKFLGIQSFAIIPLVKEGKLTAILFAANPEPTRWEDSNISLMRETAERTWSSVERARAEGALRESEHELRLLNETLEERIEERTSALVAYQDRLRSLASELNKAEERERQRLAAELHDNLGQILAMCKMELDLLKLDLDDGENHTSINGLSNLISEGIRYTRELMSELKPPPALDKEDVVSAIEWVAGVMKKHGLQVTIFDDGLPKPLSEEMRTTLFQSVKELLFNVVKHADVKEAFVKLKRLDKEVEVLVIDHGKGYQPDEETFTHGGESGFGLFNIRERVDLLGGRMRVDSSPGEGTTTAIYAPLTAEEVVDNGERSPDDVTVREPKVQERVRQHQKIRVLLVDDHEMMREGLQEMIESQEDITVIAAATDGYEAVKLAMEFSPDVIVMDVDMPGKNGIDATREILSEDPEIRVIGLSLHENPEVSSAMRSAGASAYLTKTEVFETLCETIRSEAMVTRHV